MQAKTGVAHLRLDDDCTARHLRLAPQRLQLPTELGGEVLEAQQVRLHGLQLAERLLLALAVLQNTGRLLDDVAAVLRSGLQDRSQAVLADDDVHLAADAGIAQQFLHVEEPARLAVDRILRPAVAEQRAGDGDLGVVDRQCAVAVVDGQRHFGTPEGRTAGRAGEDDVFHLAAAQGLRALLAHDPRERIDDIGLA